MPVIGHAILGLAIAVSSNPADGRRDRKPWPSFIAWALSLVVLSYVPDIVEEAGRLAGWRDSAAASHSLVFALAAAGVALPIVRAVAPADALRLLGCALLCVVSHDVADALQSPHRMPLWPLSDWRVSEEVQLIPPHLAGELLAFGPVLVAAAWWSRARPVRFAFERRADAASALAIVAIVAAAAVTSQMRHSRERDLHLAKRYMALARYPEVLDACARAERWPSTVRPGRVDYFKAEAWWRLGDRDKAAAFYVRSYEADPTFFWTVADLAVLHASADAPPAERERRTEPWLALLRSRFAGHPALPRTLVRVQRGLRPGGAP